jgi:DNA-binding transcriptional MerR regulator
VLGLVGGGFGPPGDLGTRQLSLHAVADQAKARPRRMRVMDELSSDELTDRSGVTAEQLRRLVELGIITPTPQGRFRPSDIQRIRVVDTLAEAGFAPEQLSELIATGAYDLDWASVVFPEPTAQLTTTLEAAAAATGLPEDLAARLFDVVDQLQERFPQAAELLADAAGELLAFTAFPKEHWRQIWSNNPQERLNKRSSAAPTWCVSVGVVV